MDELETTHDHHEAPPREDLIHPEATGSGPICHEVDAPWFDELWLLDHPDFPLDAGVRSRLCAACDRPIKGTRTQHACEFFLE